MSSRTTSFPGHSYCASASCSTDCIASTSGSAAGSRSIGGAGTRSSRRNGCVARRQLLVPLEQLRLPALERDLLAANQHVLHARREFERVSRPDDEIAHLPRLERAVAIGHPEYLPWRRRHTAQRLLP